MRRRARPDAPDGRVRLVYQRFRRAAGWLSARGLARWRRSLQLRVVTSTLLASSVMTVALGLFVVHRVTDGLVVAEKEQALEQLASGVTYLGDELSSIKGQDDPELDSVLRQAARNLSDRGSRATDFAVAVLPTGNRRLSPKYVPRYSPDDVRPPAQLTRLIATGEQRGYQFTRTSLDDRPARAFLVVGAPVDTQAGRFDLYYFVPLDDQVATVGLVQNSLTAIGALLLLLLAAIAGIVARQVVTPVRVAARTAERLSAGLLEERMVVRGEDELARLAHSFNQMAANLQRQIVQLENLSRLQQRFTSDVSHELRTPLTTVRMAADVIHAASDTFPPALARSTELLSNEVDRFESLLNDLLEISRYDAGAAVLEPEDTDVRTIVTRTADGLAQLAERTGSELKVVLPDEPVVAEVDPRRVERILRNLVGNAIEHGEGRPVRITLASDADALAITVRDYGVGLRPGEAQAVFDRFWRADPSRARQTGGTGLGLSISREDARLHDGWLQVWGWPALGAQFRLTLPLRRGERLSAAPLPLAPADAGSRYPRAIEASPRALPPVPTHPALTPGPADAAGTEGEQHG
ncbi:MtrAB system histidine kinase MtrB [Cryptosporangium arvum]|uniref:Sensor histidine kinase MtrB n=1 Tax=Cryptosporangium arvum DSM 44712 TaxID=927661 RepID=A0A011AD63_9ACTN|nr:MtrAB system histidine kinase MtrB [Cryptosporangium arvum]EXG79996.1 signal transduction histidine kinase [Cryptosporangium arvum DSM 44712]